MHELSVTQGMLEIVLGKAKEAHASRVAGINIVVGELSSIIGDCMQFYFDFLSEGSVASGATLSFTRIPMQVCCRNCGLSFAPDGATWSCPQCGKWDAEIIAGNELYIDSIEVE